MLWERFKEFARDTEATGSERVATVNGIADQLINIGHSDSATIAELKDSLNEQWQDLLELIETRTQVNYRKKYISSFVFYIKCIFIPLDVGCFTRVTQIFP